MSFCHHCGAKVPDGASFCGACGTKVGHSAPTQTPIPPVISPANSNESALISLKCANCGSNLEISDNMTVFNCQYCGAKQMVNRSGGHVELSLITEAVKGIQVSGEKTASELAIQRLEKEIYFASNEFTAFQQECDQKITMFSGDSKSGCLMFLMLPVVFLGFGLAITGVFQFTDYYKNPGGGALLLLIGGALMFFSIKYFSGKADRLESQRRILRAQFDKEIADKNKHISGLIRELENHRSIVEC